MRSRVNDRYWSRCFKKDDYNDQCSFFSTLRDNGLVKADPSGWLRTYSEAERFLELSKPETSHFAKYYVDEGNGLGDLKQQVAGLLSEWEDRELSADEFTLCPSGACASLIVLTALKALGVKLILFETPAYFGSVEQARELGFATKMIPTYIADAYEVPDISRHLNNKHAAFWLTQPRASLGFNQSAESLRAVAHTSKAIIVSDEVTDQSFPSCLRSVSQRRISNLFRIRSFTKGMGLNGLRIAAILHSKAHRGVIVGSLETMGGSIDAFSLLTLAKLARDGLRIRAMLEASNRQVVGLRLKAQQAVRGSDAVINPLVNGYIGSLVVDLSPLASTQLERRRIFLKRCAELQTVVILGASFYMAYDPPLESIRLNFFSQADQVLIGIRNVIKAIL